MRIKVKEVRQWMKTLDENKWRKTYNVDARRVAHFAKNMMEGAELVLPTSLQRKVEGYEYKREKKMAKEYVKVLKKRLKESREVKKLEESTRNKIRAMIKEIIKEETEYQKFFKTVLDKFEVKSQNELSDEKKKEFFNFVEKNWTKEKGHGED